MARPMIFWISVLLSMAGALIPWPSSASIVSESNYYIRILKRDGFPNAISSGAVLSLLYKDKDDLILLFDNAPPETRHENYGIVILKKGRFSHVYDIDTAECHVVLRRLRCRSRYGEDIFTDVPISDLFSGRTLNLSGDVVTSYHADKADARWLRRHGL